MNFGTPAVKLPLVPTESWRFQMASSIALWHAEHVNFARLLDVLEEQVAEIREGESPDFDRMLEIISYLRDFGDRVHHRREDAVFASLVVRDPTLQLPINRLLQEHRAIAIAGEELVTRLNEVIAGDLILRATVEAAAALYLVYYRHHLATEEREILPRAAHLLTREDWDTVARAVPSDSDPLSGEVPTET
jgi:hemerythrin-like domain-containing protein